MRNDDEMWAMVALFVGAITLPFTLPPVFYVILRWWRWWLP